MQSKLIQGSFSAKDATDLVTKIFQVKMDFHQSKIHGTLNEEDIEMRERRITALNADLNQILKRIQETNGPVNNNAEVTL